LRPVFIIAGVFACRANGLESSTGDGLLHVLQPPLGHRGWPASGGHTGSHGSQHGSKHRTAASGIVITQLSMPDDDPGGVGAAWPVVTIAGQCRATKQVSKRAIK